MVERSGGGGHKMGLSKILNRKVQVVAIAVGAILLMAVLAGFQSAGTFANDQREQLKVLTENQVSFARHSFQIQIGDLSRQLLQNLEREGSGGLSSSQEVFRQREGLGEFLAVAWLPEGGTTSWLAARPEIATRISLDFFEKRKSVLPVLAAQGSSVIWARLTEDNGQPLFVMLLEAKTTGGSGIAVGILPAQIFSEIGGFYKAQSAELLLVDEKGFAFAYTSPQYVGSQILNHPAVGRMFELGSVSSSGESTNLEGKRAIFASEKLGDSNLYVMMTNPVDTLSSFFPGYLISLAGMAVVLALFAGFFLTFLIRRQSLGFDWLKGLVKQLANGQAFLLPGDRIPDISDLREDLIKLSSGPAKPAMPVEKKILEVPLVPSASSLKERRPSELIAAPVDKIEFLREVGLGLVESLRPALSAILGHAQLARSKSGSDNQLKQHFTIIERESRRLRDILENLEGLSKEEKSDLTKADLQEVVLSILSTQRIEFLNKGVQLKKSLHENGTVMLSMKGIRFVVEEIIRNAIFAMTEAPKRELEVTTQLRGDKIALIFSDTGKGIQKELLGRVFDPFFTTQGHEERPGLGLTMAKRALVMMNGTIAIESEENKGTRVIIELPIIGTERRVFDDERTLKTLSPQRELEELTVTSFRIDENMGFDKGEVPDPPTLAPAQPLSSTIRSGPFAEDPAVSPSRVDLNNMKPLTGSLSAMLPSAPSDDEITLVGQVIGSSNDFGESPQQESESLFQNIESEFVASLPTLKTSRSPDVSEDADVAMTFDEGEDEGGFMTINLVNQASEVVAKNAEPGNLGEPKSRLDSDPLVIGDDFEVTIRPPKVRL
ncbi:MAG: sensor histidine kinase [Bdellovibrionales bacterium]|nr:sensor histidine kinase [Bdellovibrionales bacterium]